MKRFVWLWLPVVIWCGIIFWLSSIPSLRISHQPLADLLLRKTAHMSEYAVLAGLLYRAMLGNTWRWRWSVALWSGGLAWIYAMTDEMHQHFVNGRHGSPYDVLIDGVGVAIGLLIIVWWVWWKAALDTSHLVNDITK